MLPLMLLMCKTDLDLAEWSYNSRCGVLLLLLNWSHVFDPVILRMDDTILGGGCYSLQVAYGGVVLQMNPPSPSELERLKSPVGGV